MKSVPMIFLAAVIFPLTACGRTIYVDCAATGSDGSTWPDAYKYLRNALADAESGDEIRLAQGIYRPDDGLGITAGDRNASFTLKNGVTVKGGYAGIGRPDPDDRDIGLYVTILSGDLDEDDDLPRNEDNSYHVVTTGGTDSTAVLDGLTVTGGNAFTGTGTDGSNPNDRGGGIYNYNGGPTITDCIFEDNWAFHGGAMYNDANSTPTVIRCAFVRNATTGVDNCQGGAVYCDNDCNAVFIECSFVENAGNDGAAVFTRHSALETTDCIFSGNTADGQGSAISCWYKNTLVATGCIFTRNADVVGTIFDNGGTVTVANSLFIHNTGNGIFESFSQAMQVANCTFIGHYPRYGGAMCTTSTHVTVSNCILWDNTAGQIHSQNPIDIRYSCIEGWTGGGIGNITAEPQFVRYPDDGGDGWGYGDNDDFGNLHLKPGSPCLDAGDSNGVPSGVVTDLDGLDRFADDPCTPDTGLSGSAGAVVDIGAYEHHQDSPFYKHQIVFPGDSFEARGDSPDDPAWVKCTIIKTEPNIVYFQDSEQYAFHYAFATERLSPFLGMSAQDFYNVSLYREGQQAILGTVITPPLDDYGQPMFNEYGIQLVGRDPYPREEIRDLFELIRSKVHCKSGVRVFYFPSYEQTAAAEANEPWLEAQGIEISSTQRWSQGNECYSAGWALGKLKYFNGDDIEAAYLAGVLEPNDILLTDGVPAEVPFVAGIVTLSPSTPNSHVAILSRTFGVPFVHIAVPAEADQARNLTGKTVFLYAGDDDVMLIDIDGVLTEEETAEILALKVPGELDISATQSCGAYSASTEELGPADAKYFGGKAANYGILRRAIPDNCPKAAAFSFDLWNDFMDQKLTPARTLREEIDLRLSRYTYPPFSMAQLSFDLNYVRDLIKDTDVAEFTNQQERAVIDTLQDPQFGFNPGRNIRFRSSTNVEDSNQFTGAGLYDSYSGCLADDLDADEIGPCICDADEAKERGVFRAIRKVFASFYNDNAFLERLRHGVDEADVAMAILVHHSFPDEIELANGVATVEKGDSPSTWVIKLATQAGAVSVANPEDGSIPEGVDVLYTSAADIDVELKRPSNLVILGDTVMDFEADYRELSRLLILAAERFETETGKTDFMLDFEYKKTAPDGDLVVKQIREIPRLSADTLFLINKPAEYCLYQGQMEAADGDVFAYHRLKSRWQIQTRPIFLLKADNLASQSFYDDIHIEYADSGRIRAITGKLPLLPFAGHSFAAEQTAESWRLHHLQNPRLYELRTSGVVTEAPGRQSPLFTMDDYGYLELQSDYNEPVRKRLGWTSTDRVQLCPCPEPIRGKPYHHGLMQYRYCDYDGITIRTRFTWPTDTEGYPDETAPLLNWVETVISGLTSEPIVLTGEYSQTYCPKYGNDVEYFLFEPGLEPGMSRAILDELRASDVRLIYMANSYTIETYGFEDEPFLAADTDGDGDVDMADYATFAGRWLESVCDDCGGADLDGDGRVGPGDFCEFGSQWGP
ncbi:MAG: right-handed parallel beta-helix repeat-containing protein [Sedimentisphaerales bacterium]|nr:right-handed parallel beta-helix repeat-containing protein [Sedimentisphaerales bacterium]